MTIRWLPLSATAHMLPSERASFTTVSKASRSPNSHYLLLPLPVLALVTRLSIKVPVRILLLDLFTGNMIQRHPPEEGCSERQCAVAPEQHIKDAQPNTGMQGSGVGESGTYTFATLARSDHCSPCPQSVRVTCQTHKKLGASHLAYLRSANTASMNEQE